MPDFDSLRQQLAAAQKSVSDAQGAHFISNEKLKKLRQASENLDRIFDPRNQSHSEQRRQLDEAIKKAEAEASHSKTVWDRGKIAAGGIFKDFEIFTDPREQIGKLRDEFPVLLFPVRIETRFKKLTVNEQVHNELWVRIYPDDCAVDTFEKILSETEVKNARFYWAKIWEAGGREADERGAWRTLVSSHGSGRASYIIDQYKPASLADKPTKTEQDETILVISAEQLPTDAEQAALKAYWGRIWQISGNKAEEEAALQQLIDNVAEGKADTLIATYTPFNINVAPTPPTMREDVRVQVVFLLLPPAGSIDTKQASWSQAPQTVVMPDRFVVIGYQGTEKAIEVIGKSVPSPLFVGPDPSAAPEEQFKTDPATGELIVADDIKWMVDFDAAIQNGLGFKIPLNDIQATRGFERLIVLGVRMAADEKKGQEMVETLIEHHRLGRKGFSLLKQGTPTNNTDTDGAGHQSLDDPDESFDDQKIEKLFDVTNDVFLKKDGQWLAEGLGINYSSLYKVKNSGHTDGSEGRLMNLALWPATMGYMMQTLMQPVFSDADMTHTRDFFNRFVSGRGSLPAIKIGKQPYGILPTTAFSKIKWLQQSRTGIQETALAGGGNFLAKLYTILEKIDADWASLFGKIPHVGQSGGDAHQVLLDVVGLNASSVEFYQRTAESKEDLFNRFNLKGLGGSFIAALVVAGYIKSGQDLLKNFGYNGNDVPDILNKFFLKSQNLLKGPLIDDRPLSETDGIRNYTSAPLEENYIQWLVNAARTSHNALRQQQGFTGNNIPTALLYLMLHHALDLGYIEVSLLLFQQASLLSADGVKAAKAEPPFLHLQASATRSESKWQYLYAKEAKITGVQDLEVGAYIPKILKTEIASAYLNQQLNALDMLKDVPTARLERAFAEHIDCCTYRLDAWKGGIMQYGLSLMRGPVRDDAGNPAGTKKGVYIGAYGWLENLRPENKQLTPVSLRDQELIDVFVKDQPTPIVRDNTNGGYILAPSLNHAVTASILRNGYIANKNPEALRVNLSSERVRKALSVIEGMRGGQSLGALLGYQLERSLHDGYPGVELDFFIYGLRKAFPLVTNKNKDTKVDETSEQPINSVEAIEARNVIDGLALIEQIKKSGATTYPFGKTFLKPVDAPAQAAAINDAVNKMMDSNDAVADVALAESVHQIVQGNYERGAATFDTYSKGSFPPIPDVIQTPRSGTNLTHRVGLQFQTGLNGAAEPTPRAQAEPGMNKWLAGVLPPVNQIVCLATYNAVVDEEITAADLGLAPVDLLYVIKTDSGQAMKELDDRIVKLVLDKPTVRPDTAVSVNYMKRVANKITFFELAPLLNSLNALLLRSKPLVPADVMLPGDAKDKSNDNQFLDSNKLMPWFTALQNLVNTSLLSYQTSIGALVEDVITNRNQIIAQVDSFLANYATILTEAGKTGLPQTGVGFIYDEKKALYAQLIKKPDELIARWDNHLTQFDQAISDYDALPASATAEEKFELLQKARSNVSTLFPLALPADPDAYKGNVLSLRGTLVTKQTAFKTIKNTTTKSLTALLNAIYTELPVSDFDLVPLDITDVENSIVLLVQDLAGKADNLATDLNNRLQKAQTFLDEAASLPDGAKKVEAVLNAAKLLYTDEFKMIPEFELPADRADEWANTFNAQSELLAYAETQAGSDFPVDDWLYGIARVREKMHHWENTVLLSEAFGRAELALHPVQFPYKAGDPWLALPFPETYQIDSDRLLYTAHYATDFDKTQRQCGLLVDEWTEVIPAKTETAGVAFHYDRPNTEPPQTLLLAMPTQFTGGWQWQDLLDVVSETLDAAKKRAIEPAQIDTTAYTRFLPAVVSSVTTFPITASLNFAFNNSLHEILAKNE